jgi:hypothetical protein
MEKHKKIGKNIFVSILPWSNGKFVIQASGGTKEVFFRGRSKPISFKKAIKGFKDIKTKRKTGKFIKKNALRFGE